MKAPLLAGLFAPTLLLLSACGGNGSSTTPVAPQSQAQAPAQTQQSASAQSAADAPFVEKYVIGVNARRVCPESSDPNVKSCLAIVATGAQPAAMSPDAGGYGPSQLQSAYKLPSSTAGAGQTIAVVDAYDDPKAESDLAFYRSHYGLPACSSSSGCFRKVNQNGNASPLPAPAGNSGWDLEESLDVQMVAAICPNCKVILVETNSASTTDLGTGVNSAVTLGANAVSNSYGGGGTAGASYYNHPGTIITASAGDNGYGVGTPAGFPTVVSVGGTALTAAANSRGWKETVWNGTGSGCEKTLAKPSWQKDTGCTGRTMNDVAADASLSTGVAIYDTYSEHGFIEVGGTSVSSPVIAAVYGLAGNAATLDAAQSLYATGAKLFDVTKGSNGSCSPAYLCTGKKGYDGPTGNGTPNGVTAF